jgi:protoporphyrinogen oxidase
LAYTWDRREFKPFIKPLIDDSDICFNHRAISIDTAAKEVHFQNGLIVHYKKLVSTLPLPSVVKILKNCPDHIIKAASKLNATSIDLISVGFNKQIIKDLWFYIYDEDVYASRAYSPSVKSADNAPDGCSSLQFEVYNRGLEPSKTRDELIENTFYAMKKMNLCKSEDIIFVDHRRLDYGNVVFDMGMEYYRKKVLDYLLSLNIRSCGRFGEWDYLWSNQSFMSGYESN